jgi:hypothetical protein
MKRFTIAGLLALVGFVTLAAPAAAAPYGSNNYYGNPSYNTGGYGGPSYNTRGIGGGVEYRGYNGNGYNDGGYRYQVGRGRVGSWPNGGGHHHHHHNHLHHGKQPRFHHSHGHHHGGGNGFYFGNQDFSFGVRF